MLWESNLADSLLSFNFEQKAIEKPSRFLIHVADAELFLFEDKDKTLPNQEL